MQRNWAALLVVMATLTACGQRAGIAETRSFRSTALLERLPGFAYSAPSPTAAVKATREDLRSSLAELDRILEAAGSQKHAGWRTWLDLASLESQLDAERPDAAKLNAHLIRYSRGSVGLEMPALVALRNDLKKYLAAAEYASADNPQRLVTERLTELSDLLNRLDVEPTAADAGRAGQIVAWLEALGDDGASLAAAVREQYCHTNAVVQGSARLINLLLERSVSDQRSFAETVLGSFTRGTAYTRAQVSFGFVPSQERATLELRMQGLTNCPANVAETRRVSVYSASTTSIRGSKQVFLTAEGLELAPSVASATTVMQINDIEAGRRLIERLAWRRAGQIAPQAEELTSQRAQAEASSKLDREAATALAGMNNMFRDKIRAPLIRRNALPADWRFSTDQSHMRVSLTQHNEAQLAAATPTPRFPAGYDVALAAHESMIVNLAESMLGGSTVPDSTWLEIIKLLSGEEPRALWVHDRAERWSVTLDKERPLVPRFEEDQASFALRLASVQRGERVFNHPVEIEATFTLSTSRDGPVLKRDRELAIRFPSEPSLDSRQPTETFLRQKFSAVFPPELVFYGIVPPDGGSLGKLNALELAEFHTAAGWMTIGYSLKDAE